MPTPQRPFPTSWLGPWMEYRPMMPVTDPRTRIWFGISIASVGGLAAMIEHLGNGRHWLCGLALQGVAMLVSGCSQIRYEKRIRAEMDRARDQWSDLLAGATAARTRGLGVARFVQQCGYRDFAVRRWIVARLKRDLAVETQADHLASDKRQSAPREPNSRP